MKILLTNWINFFGVFIAVFLYAIFYNIYDESATRNFYQSTVAAFILVSLYGILFWGLYITELILFDLLFIVKDQSKLKKKLIIEWLLISIPFIYWIIFHKQLIFLVGVIVFLITQLIRQNLIIKFAT
jgi:hypothetical protein